MGSSKYGGSKRSNGPSGERKGVSGDRRTVLMLLRSCMSAPAISVQRVLPMMTNSPRAEASDYALSTHLLPHIPGPISQGLS